MVRAFLKNKRFVLGGSFILLLLISSIVYSVLFDNHIPVASIMTDENGTIVGKPPYSPWVHPPFGTDHVSRDLFFIILIGAKYTLGLALGIALIRFVFSSVAGILLQLYFPSFLKKGKPWFEGFYYFPASILAYLFLFFILREDGYGDGFSTTFTERVIFEMIVLIIIGIPIILINVSKEVAILQRKEFIDSVKVLGGSRWHLLTIHLMPYLHPQLFLLFVREVIQVLLLLAHLGILNLLFGGALLKTDMFDKAAFVSLSSEWSGLIGTNFRFLYTSYYWIPLVPILCFTLAILAFKLMVEGMEYVLDTKQIVRNQVEEKGEKIAEVPSKKEAFDYL
ncbi:hypothetical protein [Pseudalkalibacillus hwajinpoensis]|uniref:hypothetical protein n=1 Tax=Guptibacillus hwajinpoensis TaxID=208199 RepID=UPI001CFCD28C|nr:hypothetical protein [Pseudalkalibacillus hwajinpoensis]